MSRMRELLLGSPLPTERLGVERLGNLRALAAFSPDALSSIAYANQEIYLGLVVAGAAGLARSWPIALAITALLAAVALSYFQTVHAYPGGGGSYTVARENLGGTAGLVAAAALLIDYVLTAAVSLTAGVAAIASAFPVLWPYRVSLSLLFLAIIALANLRGLRESGAVMAVPVYLFLFSYLAMLAYGAVRAWTVGSSPFPVAAGPATQPLTTFMILHTFASGCTALTGIEAISNGVPAFKRPEARNAGRTLLVMALLMGTLFLGSVGLTHYLGVVAGPEETILSALARRVLGRGFAYFLVQTVTMLILTVAANTSFAGFPRLVSILGRDGHLPRQLSQLGDRLVFANGIVLLAVFTGLLIVVFGGDTHALIPLFAVGVFLAFSLSQAGMVLHWVRQRGPAWAIKAFLNAVGALATSVTFGVIAVSKFIEGAWIVVLLIPLILAVFGGVGRHYRQVARSLTLRGLPPSLRPLPGPRVVLPVAGVHRGVIEALRYARSISEHVTAVYVEVDPGAAEKVRRDWDEWGMGVPLVVVPSPYRSIVGPLLAYLDRTDREHNDGQLATVILPEFIPARWWHYPLHNQTAMLIRLAMLYRRRRQGRGRAIIDIPFYLEP